MNKRGELKALLLAGIVILTPSKNKEVFRRVEKRIQNLKLNSFILVQDILFYQTNA